MKRLLGHAVCGVKKIVSGSLGYVCLWFNEKPSWICRTCGVKKIRLRIPGLFMRVIYIYVFIFNLLFVSQKYTYWTELMPYVINCLSVASLKKNFPLKFSNFFLSGLQTKIRHRKMITWHELKIHVMN